MTKSDYLEARILNWVCRGAAIATLTNAYITLFMTTPPSDAGGGTEMTYTGATPFARVTIGVGNFDRVATGGTITNTAVITFPTNDGTARSAIAVGIYDAAVAGNLLYWQVITPVPVGNGETPRFSIGSIVITED